MKNFQTDSENDESRFQDVEQTLNDDRYSRYLLYFVLCLFFLFCIFVGFDSFAQNFGYGGACYDSSADALSFFRGQFPVISGLSSFSISNVSIASNTVTYTLSSLDITTGVVFTYSPVTLVLADCDFHYSLSQVSLGLGLVLITGIGFLTGVVYLR
jgi:hypothetical protein